MFCMPPATCVHVWGNAITSRLIHSASPLQDKSELGDKSRFELHLSPITDTQTLVRLEDELRYAQHVLHAPGYVIRQAELFMLCSHAAQSPVKKSSTQLLLHAGPATAPHSHLVCGGCTTLLMYPQASMGREWAGLRGNLSS